jgi:hypothetical protein
MEILWGGPGCSPGRPLEDPVEILWGAQDAPFSALWERYGYRMEGLGSSLKRLWGILWKSYGVPRLPHTMPPGESYGHPTGGLGCSLGCPLGNPMDILWGASGAPLGVLWRILWKSYWGPRVLP